MHFFQEDALRCFSEQTKIFAKELNIPLNAGREAWARIHGCENAHEAVQRMKKGEAAFCESVIACKRTLGRFPGQNLPGLYPDYFQKSFRDERQFVKGLEPKVVLDAALKAKGIPRRWSSAVKIAPLFDGDANSGVEFLDDLTCNGSLYVAAEDNGCKTVMSLYDASKDYRRQRRVRGVLLGFPEAASSNNFAVKLLSEEIFSSWSVPEIVRMFEGQILGKNRQAEVWEYRCLAAVKAVVGFLSIVNPRATFCDLKESFKLDSLIALRNRHKEQDIAQKDSFKKAIGKLDDFLLSMPGCYEEDLELGLVGIEAVKHFQFLSMQIAELLIDLTMDVDIDSVNLFPDLGLPRSERPTDEFLRQVSDVVKDLPNYSLVFIDIRRINERSMEGISIIKRIRELCRDNRAYAIWCGTGSDKEQSAMSGVCDEIFEVGDQGELRPFF